MTVLSTTPWVIRLNVRDAIHLGAVRQFAGLRVLVLEESLWLRGDTCDPALSRCVQTIPHVDWFALQSENQLTRRDETVPRERLPEGNWRALRDWLELELPRPGFAARVDEQVPLRLVRSTITAEANLLRTQWDTWHDYAVSAPRIRLNHLSFAVSHEFSVLVRGVPLPPLSGRRFVETNRIALPLSWRFEPHIGSPTVGKILQLAANEIALFSEEGAFERLPESAFVLATRSAVRMTHGS
jgi:hypothetical protein